MKTINIYDAKTRLSSILQEVLDGEDIVIAKNGEPLVQLVPYKSKSKKRPLGKYKGQIKMSDDFDSLPEEVLSLFYK